MTVDLQRREPPADRATTPVLDGSRLAGTVLWAGSVATPTGFGEEVRGFTRYLRRLGFPLKSLSIDDREVAAAGLSCFGPEVERELGESSRQVLYRPITAVLHVGATTPFDELGADHQVVRTMWETDRLHAAAVAGLNLMDEVWVPSRFNVESFRRAGVTAPLQAIGSGVDTTAYRPGLEPLEIDGTHGTVFLSMFEWSFRKGWDVLLRAWSRAFRPDDEVTLVLRTYPRDHFVLDDALAAQSEALLGRALGELGLERDCLAPIVVLGCHLAGGEVPRLMASADCYVAPSRGEGWGRPQLEAMASGLPVIATNWSGNLEFMDDENSLLIEIEGLVPVDIRMDSPYYHGQRWAEPSVEHLTQLLVRVARDAGLRERIGSRARRDVEARWRWEDVAAAAADRLLALAGGRAASPGTRAGHIPSRKARRRGASR